MITYFTDASGYIYNSNGYITTTSQITKIKLGLSDYCKANIIVTEKTSLCYKDKSRKCDSKCAAWITVEGEGHEKVIGYCADVYGLEPLENCLIEKAKDEN